ncbi:MAG: SNF2 family DNA or RNA helicase [Mariniblastus sp.]|jgi:SNF2 family DNA or RNA helicase
MIAYRMIRNANVEEKTISLQASKHELADCLINASEPLIRLMTAEDLPIPR